MLFPFLNSAMPACAITATSSGNAAIFCIPGCRLLSAGVLASSWAAALIQNKFLLRRVVCLLVIVFGRENSIMPDCNRLLRELSSALVWSCISAAVKAYQLLLTR